MYNPCRTRYDLYVTGLIVFLVVAGIVLAILGVTLVVFHRVGNKGEHPPSPLTGVVRPPNDEDKE